MYCNANSLKQIFDYAFFRAKGNLTGVFEYSPCFRKIDQSLSPVALSRYCGFAIKIFEPGENNGPITVKRLKEILQNEPDDSVVTFLDRFSTLRDELNTVVINSVANVEGKIVLVANDYYYNIDQ